MSGHILLALFSMSPSLDSWVTLFCILFRSPDRRECFGPFKTHSRLSCEWRRICRTRIEPVGEPYSEVCLQNWSVIWNNFLANEYICDSYRKTDWPTTLKFDRAPSLVIIYLPTKIERDWLRKDGKVFFFISSDPVQQTLTFDPRRWNFTRFVYSLTTIA